jgi:hypothetical protein
LTAFIDAGATASATAAAEPLTPSTTLNQGHAPAASADFRSNWQQILHSQEASQAGLKQAPLNASGAAATRLPDAKAIAQQNTDIATAKLAIGALQHPGTSTPTNSTQNGSESRKSHAPKLWSDTLSGVHSSIFAGSEVAIVPLPACPEVQVAVSNAGLAVREEVAGGVPIALSSAMALGSAPIPNIGTDTAKQESQAEDMHSLSVSDDAVDAPGEQELASYLALTQSQQAAPAIASHAGMTEPSVSTQGGRTASNSDASTTDDVPALHAALPPETDNSPAHSSLADSPTRTTSRETQALSPALHSAPVGTTQQPRPDAQSRRTPPTDSMADASSRIKPSPTATGKATSNLHTSRHRSEPAYSAHPQIQAEPADPLPTAAAVRSENTANFKTRVEAQPTAAMCDPFAALDDHNTEPATAFLQVGSHHAEAGYLDPSLGWVGVRASGSGGALHATIVPGSGEAAQALGGHLSALNSFVTEHHGRSSTVTVTTADHGQQQSAHSQSGDSSPQQQPQQQSSYGNATTPTLVAAAASTSAQLRSNPDAHVYSREGTHISVIA